MKVTVIGKTHLSGNSKKTGKPYDSTVAHVTCKKNGVDGLAAESIWLDAKTYPLEAIAIGKTYDCDRDSSGYIIAFDQL
jgi:hypothetical protein